MILQGANYYMAERKLKSIIGPPGPPGKSILSGSGVPSNTLGTDGEFYIDTDSYGLYGPKTSGTWPSPPFDLGGGGTATAPDGSALNPYIHLNFKKLDAEKHYLIGRNLESIVTRIQTIDGVLVIDGVNTVL